MGFGVVCLIRVRIGSFIKRGGYLFTNHGALLGGNINGRGGK